MSSDESGKVSVRTVTYTAIEGLPLIRPGDNLGEIIVRGMAAQGLRFDSGDILVVCQKIVSKAEGRIRRLSEVQPSAFAQKFARQWQKDARVVELVLQESRRIVRMDHGLLIVETGPGWVCANAGIDESNLSSPDEVTLLPLDPDRSAQALRNEIRRLCGVDIAVIITDTFGRPWRVGLIDFCLGIAGMEPLLDLRGSRDLTGRELHHTVMAVADQIAAAAGLLMGKADGIPAVLVRGYQYRFGSGSAKALIREPGTDLFR